MGATYRDRMAQDLLAIITATLDQVCSVVLYIAPMSVLQDIH